MGTHFWVSIRIVTCHGLIAQVRRGVAEIRRHAVVNQALGRVLCDAFGLVFFLKPGLFDSAPFKNQLEHIHKGLKRRSVRID